MAFNQQVLLPLNQLKPGMMVAQTIISFTGKVLLQKGRILTAQIIRDLLEWDIDAVEIVLFSNHHDRKPDLKMIYAETLHATKLAFEKLRMFKEVPILEFRELVEERIRLMVDIVEIVDFLHDIKVHNEYTFKHSLNVAIIAGIIGKWLGYKGEQLKELILAGLLHDIGKVFVPQEILNKPGRLTAAEMRIIEAHSLQGYNLLIRTAAISDDVKAGVAQHHERLDGSGYPLNLSGTEITTYAKIIAIADIYDALTNERVYRRKLTPFSALEIILEELYDKLDPTIALIFIINIRSYLSGCSVLLNTGQKAKVVLLNNEFPTKPVVQLGNNTMIDLRQNENIEIIDFCEER
jgi:putative nucleotidyltransferase with HDIG domain